MLQKLGAEEGVAVGRKLGAVVGALDGTNINGDAVVGDLDGSEEGAFDGELVIQHMQLACAGAHTAPFVCQII